MNFENFQAAWQSNDHSTPLNVPTELLLKEVRRNHRYFEAMLLRRDLVEVGAAAMVAGFFGYIGYHGQDWTLFLAAVLCLAVGLFLLADRRLQRRRRPKTDDSLQSAIEASLLQVNHQIWLLRNILWWYILPAAVAWAIVAVRIAWKFSEFATPFIWFGQVVYALLSLYLFYGIYRLNQNGVKRELIPRREELETLLASLRS
jgi:hypothetical protein